MFKVDRVVKLKLTLPGMLLELNEQGSLSRATGSRTVERTTTTAAAAAAAATAESRAADNRIIVNNVIKK